MPAVNFELEWPDGDITTCYSPSSVVCETFREGESMTISELAAACETAFDRASQRVEERFGMPCRAAMRQKDLLIRKSKGFAPDEQIRIISMQFHES